MWREKTTHHEEYKMLELDLKRRKKPNYTSESTTQLTKAYTNKETDWMQETDEGMKKEERLRDEGCEILGD